MDAIQGNQIQTANDRAIEHHDLVDVEHIILGWILVIIIGLIFSGAGSSITSNSYFSFVKSFLLNSGSFILVYPGPIIFPIIAGAIIGREIGKGSNNLKNASKSGLMNGFYGANSLGDIIPREYQTDLIGDFDRTLVDVHRRERAVIEETITERKANHIKMAKDADRKKLENYNDYYTKDYIINKKVKELKRKNKQRKLK